MRTMTGLATSNPASTYQVALQQLLVKYVQVMLDEEIILKFVGITKSGALKSFQGSA